MKGGPHRVEATAWSTRQTQSGDCSTETLQNIEEQ
uniref:Uncharacterized protein n=1 Tax=Anguilla anguilla TaxID=7936 RepID=A0A0E9QXI5_ANGAN